MNPDMSEFISLRMANANKVLAEVVDYQIENQLWNTAVNRLYYACYYAVSALLYSKDFNSKTHSGTKRLFEQHFINTGIISTEAANFYARLFGMRQNADYEDEIDYEREDVIILVQPAKDLIASIESILTKES